MGKSLEQYCAEFQAAGNNRPKLDALEEALYYEHSVRVYMHYSLPANKWMATAHPGNDLEYFGEGPTIGDAATKALQEVLKEYQ